MYLRSTSSLRGFMGVSCLVLGGFWQHGEDNFSRTQASISKNGLTDANHQWATCN